MKKFSNSISNRLTGRHKYSLRLCGDLKGLKVLDVGSSFGWFEKLSLRSGVKRIVGIEPDINEFYRAKKEVPGATFKVGSALNIPEKDSVYDMVVMFDVIEHLPVGTEDQALSEIYRVLKPGGVFVLSTDYSHWFSKIMDPAWYFGHRHYSLERLVKLFNNAGFLIQEYHKKGGIFEIVGTILLYFFKWIFRTEIPFKAYFDKQKDIEYIKKRSGIVTIFIRAVK